MHQWGQRMHGCMEPANSCLIEAREHSHIWGQRIHGCVEPANLYLDEARERLHTWGKQMHSSMGPVDSWALILYWVDSLCPSVNTQLLESASPVSNLPHLLCFLVLVE